MTSWTRNILLVVWVALLEFAWAGADFEFGGRPGNHVFDATGTLDLELAGEVSNALVRIDEDEGIDVVLVVLDGLKGDSPTQVARRFTAAWCDSPIHSVVLHVPENPASPWIVPAGKLVDQLKPAFVAQAVVDAQRRAALEPTGSGKVRAAATEAADMLRYWMGNAINRSEYIKTESVKMQLELDGRSRQRRIVMLMGAASVLPVLVGLSMLYLLLRKPGPRRFPVGSIPRRLGAPHSGGNHVVVDLGPPPL